MMKKTFAALALSGLFATAQASVLLQQGFDNVGALSGWVMNNASTPGGVNPGWFQGDSQAFAAHSGVGSSYIAASWLAAPSGGLLNDWLITPQFSTANAVVVSLWLKSAGGGGDDVKFGFSNGGTTLANFSMNPVLTAPDDWTLYTVKLAAQGAGSVGRFAIDYTGLDDNANYIGVDDFSVSAASANVPEPGTLFVLAAGLIGLGAARRWGPRS